MREILLSSIATAIATICTYDSTDSGDTIVHALPPPTRYFFSPFSSITQGSATVSELGDSRPYLRPRLPR